ncbi:MAG TPA: hypothetical protein VKR79_05655 [Gaiellaceae bacterium]|nr:hypothetical protein [Gaiellaceae bacterium]
MGALVAALVGAPAVAVPAAVAASPSSQCLVRNGLTRYTSLATAITAAGTNATLNISGTCAGTFTVTRSMTLQRLGPVGVLTPGGGNGQGTGTVLTGEEARVVVKGLTITGGQRGVYNENGNLTLFLCTVTDNSGGLGGGVYNVDGNLNLVGTSVADNSSVGGYGAGIDNYEGTVTLSQNSSVYGNDAGIGGGVENHEGTLTLNDGSSIGDNSAEVGGGVDNFEGSVTLNGHSSISGNEAILGGGIFNEYATVTMTGTSSISYNSAELGGGIYNAGGSLYGATAGVNVFDNSPNDID